MIWWELGIRRQGSWPISGAGREDGRRCRNQITRQRWLPPAGDAHQDPLFPDLMLRFHNAPAQQPSSPLAQPLFTLPYLKPGALLLRLWSTLSVFLVDARGVRFCRLRLRLFFRLWSSGLLLHLAPFFVLSLLKGRSSGGHRDLLDPRGNRGLLLVLRLGHL